MPNPLFSIFGNAQGNSMMNMLSQFQNFKRTFSGDPQQRVQELLNSGQMTQEQFNQLSQMAKQMRQFMK